MENIIKLINQTLEFNDIKSFKDIITLNNNEVKNEKLYPIVGVQWVNNNNCSDSDIMLYQLNENFIIYLKGLQEKQIPKYLRCFKPFDIYFIIGKYDNYYVVVVSEKELCLIVMNKEVIFPTVKSEYIILHTEKSN